MRRGHNQHGHRCREAGRKIEEKKPQHAGQCNLMQDAEKYEAVGRHIPCHGTDCCCRRYDLQEPLGHRAPAYAATMGKYEAEADQKQEAGGYAARKELPSALCCRRRCHIAKNSRSQPK